MLGIRGAALLEEKDIIGIGKDTIGIGNWILKYPPCPPPGPSTVVYIQAATFWIQGHTIGLDGCGDPASDNDSRPVVLFDVGNCRPSVLR